MPKNITARPTTDFARENIFNVLENMLDFDGLRALDLFAGTGAVSIELLSRGCESVTAVEKEIFRRKGVWRHAASTHVCAARTQIRKQQNICSISINS